MGWYESRRGYSTLTDVCTMYGVNEKTVRNWISYGYISAEVFEHEKPKYWIPDESLQAFDNETHNIFANLPTDTAKEKRGYLLGALLSEHFKNKIKEDKPMEENQVIEAVSAKPEEPISDMHEGYISVKELNHRLLKIKRLQDTKDEFIEARLRQATQLVMALYGCEEADIPKDKLDEMRHLVYASPEVKRMENDIDGEFDSVQEWMQELGVSDRLIGLVVG